ncbi:MAG: RDD family protein [Hyphomonadaceae bacterium]
MSEADQWFYKMGEAELGPVSEAELIDLYRDGQMSGETLVREAGQEAGKQMVEAFPHLIEVPPLTSPGDGWTDPSPHPWRRFFARTIDLNVNAFVFVFAWTLLMTTTAPNQSDFWAPFFVDQAYSFPRALLTTAFSFLGNIPFMAYSGTTLGKWIFGIRITHVDGRPMGLWIALKREFAVYVRAYFLMVPIANLFTLAGAYETLTSEGKTSWDRDYALMVKQRPDSDVQTLVGVVVVILFLVAAIWTNLPPEFSKAP